MSRRHRHYRTRPTTRSIQVEPTHQISETLAPATGSVKHIVIDLRRTLIVTSALVILLALAGWLSFRTGWALNLGNHLYPWLNIG